MAVPSLVTVTESVSRDLVNGFVIVRQILVDRTVVFLSKMSATMEKTTIATVWWIARTRSAVLVSLHS